MATLVTIPMLCSKVEKKGKDELVSFTHPRFGGTQQSAKFRNDGTTNGDVQVTIRDETLQNQFTPGGTYPILLTV